MNKVYYGFIFSTLITLLAISSYAANGQGIGTGSGQGTGNSQAIWQGPEGTGTTQPVQNQNKVQTQNKGEEQKLQVQTQEEQGVETGSGANANNQGTKKGLSETRSSVAKQIQELLSARTAPGGIEDQVRQWARSQQQAETKIQDHLAKIESKSGLARSLFGPNYGSLNALKQEMNQNRVRVQQLEKLKLQLTTQEDISNVQEMIALLNEENSSLQTKINYEEANGGLFGWLVQLFAK